MIKFNSYVFENPTEAEKKLQEKMQRAVDKMMEEQNRLEDEATIKALRKYGYEVTRWIPVSMRTPPEGEDYFVTVRYEDHSEIHIAEFSKLHGFMFDEGGEEYWTAQDIKNGEASVIAWAELLRPYEKANP